MKLFLIPFLLLATSLASAAPSDACPSLPEGSGLEWQHHAGPLYDVCYAVGPESKHLAFGLLLGTDFSFNPSPSERVAAGRIGGYDINWYRTAAQPTSWQALLHLSGNPGRIAHVFVVANEERLLRERLAIMGRLAFNP